MPPLVLASPAKLNLFLAITGRRPDGFHDLVSVVVLLDWGDELTVTCDDHSATSSVMPGAEPRAEFTLHCTHPEVPLDASNLILRAAAAYAAAQAADAAASGRLHSTRPLGGRVELLKRIPLGAGLGGGSSNAATMLRALDTLAEHPLGPARLAALAAGLGSDCPLFLHGQPLVMRGRGELITPLPASAVARLRGRRVIVAKPASFSIATPWAYAQLVAGAPASYLPAAAAEERLAAWLDDPTAPAEALLYNNMEPPAFRRYLALPMLAEVLREEFGLFWRMTGSGSACFAFLPEAREIDAAAVVARIRQLWGEEATVAVARLS